MVINIECGNETHHTTQETRIRVRQTAHDVFEDGVDLYELLDYEGSFEGE